RQRRLDPIRHPPHRRGGGAGRSRGRVHGSTPPYQNHPADQPTPAAQLVLARGRKAGDRTHPAFARGRRPRIRRAGSLSGDGLARKMSKETPMATSLIRSHAMITRVIDRKTWEERPDGAVLQEDGIITAVGTFADLQRKYPGIPVLGSGN